MASKDDPFTTAYLAGMPDTLEGTVPVRPRPRTLPREAIALGGQVITPDGVRKGWVRIEGGTVAAITTRRPTTALAIQTDLGIPIKLVGLGETASDLVDFDPDEFVEALFA